MTMHEQWKFFWARPILFEALFGGTWDESFDTIQVPTDALIDPHGEIVFVGAASDSCTTPWK